MEGSAGGSMPTSATGVIAPSSSRLRDRPVLDSLRKERASPDRPRASFLVVSDIQAARDELMQRGVEVSEVFHFAKARRSASRSAAPRPITRATARTPRSPTRTGTAGCCRRSPLDSRAGSSRRNGVRFGERSGKRDAAGGSGPWGAREAHRRARRRLADLVRDVHGGGAGRHRAAGVREWVCLVLSRRELQDGWV